MNKTTLMRILAMIAAVVLALTGCSGDDDNGDDGTQPGGDADAEAAEITIENFAFSGDITVQAGQEITVTNNDSVAHSFTADDDEFDTGLIDGGSSTTLTIDTPGSYDFHCTPHPDMTGTITVE